MRKSCASKQSAAATIHFGPADAPAKSAEGKRRAALNPQRTIDRDERVITRREKQCVRT